MQSQPNSSTSHSEAKPLSNWLTLALIIVFLTIGSLLIIHFTSNTTEEKNLTNSAQTTECIYKNKTYKNNESFGADDGCNLCKCIDGEIECSQLPCDQELEMRAEENSYFGYLKDFYTKEDRNYIKFQTAEFITSEQEELLQQKCGENSEECPNSYYIDKSNSELIDLEITSESDISVISDSNNNCAFKSDETGKFKKFKLNYEDFKNSTCEFDNSTFPFQIETTGSTANEITQVFLP